MGRGQGQVCPGAAGHCTGRCAGRCAGPCRGSMTSSPAGKTPDRGTKEEPAVHSTAGRCGGRAAGGLVSWGIVVP